MNNINNTFNNKTFIKTMSDKDFRQLSQFIHSKVGIKMPDVKKTMLESRLQKRLRALKYSSFSEYIEYVFSPEGLKNELVNMIDVVTTNKTDFFREPAHFDQLINNVVPELINTKRAGIKKQLMLWSAGCSTGEEPYTISMVLSEFAEKHSTMGFSFSILATDISTKVLDKASQAIYTHEKIEPIPIQLRKKYLLRGKNNSEKLVRIVPKLRNLIKFRRINFFEGSFGFREPMDIIFCRNVIIYFDRSTQEKLLNKFCNHLAPGGYIFMGHSETLSGLDVPLDAVYPTVYRKPE